VALLSLKDAAAFLGVSERSLGRQREHLAAAGLVRRVGNRWKYDAGPQLRETFNGLVELQPGNAARLEAEALQQADQDAAAGKIPPYAQSRAKREHFGALLAQRQLEQLEGRLVELSAVKSVVFEEHRRARDQLLGLPNRISAELFSAKTTADLAIRLEKAIHCTLVELSDGTGRKLNKMGEGING